MSSCNILYLSNFTTNLCTILFRVPVIPSETCMRDNIYGQDKLSTGMFCAGILEVMHYNFTSTQSFIKVVKDKMKV